MGSLAASMIARLSGCVKIVGPRDRLQSSRSSVLFHRLSGSGFDRLRCSGVEVDGVE